MRRTPRYTRVLDEPLLPGEPVHHGGDALRQRLVLGLLLVIVVGAWGTRGPSAAIGLPVADPAAAPSGVSIIDHVGIVTGVHAAPGVVAEGIRPGGRPDQVVVGWMGGWCEPRTTLTIRSEGTGLRIEEATEPCSGFQIGITRAVTLDLAHPVGPDAIRLVSSAAPG